MPRTILLPVGLSVLEALKKRGVQLTTDYEAALLTEQLVESFGDEADYLSAELSTLKKLKASDEDEAVFLATDTNESESAAKANARIAQLRFALSTKTKRVKALVLDDAKKFREEGLRSLIWALDEPVGKALEQNREPILSIGGGIKSVVPYIALYGMLRRVPITYIFERTRELVYLPPLPIGFDWASLQVAEAALREINRDGYVPTERLQQLLGENLRSLEGLFEKTDHDHITFSAFGFLLLGDLERASQTPVMLSPSAQSGLHSLQGVQRKVIESMLDSLRNPLIRAHKLHAFEGTDLAVYKPGNTGPRIAYFEQGGGVYVAEIYATHDEYTRDLSSHRKADYEPAKFTRFWRTEPSVKEEVPGEDVIAIANREIEQANRAKTDAEAQRDRAVKELDEALSMAAPIEAELNKIRQEAEALRTRVRELATERQVRNSWRLWQRLRWALFDS